MDLPSLFSSTLALFSCGVLASCSATRPLPTPNYVDIDRFMGTWFVLGYTPLVVDKEAHNGIEHYHLAENGDIETTYQFRKRSFDGELKTMTPVGRVYDAETNAEWRMQFLWPFKAAYVVMDLSDDYGTTIVAHPNRKYAWIMARKPEIPEADYERMLGLLEKEGFDMAAIQRLPQDWRGETTRLKMLEKVAGGGRLVTGQ